jgi:hypothetical protein
LGLKHRKWCHPLSSFGKIVKIDLDKFVRAKPSHGMEKRQRGLIAYLLWNKGVMINEQL